MSFKTALFFPFLFPLFLYISCEKLPPDYSSTNQDARYAILDTWLSCETAAAVYNTTHDPEDRERLLLALDDAAEALRLYQRGIVYRSYAYTAYSQEAMITRLLSDFEALKNAARTGGPVPPETGAIRAAIIEWQEYNEKIINRIHLNYVYLLMFFTAAILIISLLLWRLNRNLSIARRNENRSAAFIRQSMLAQEKERSRISRELHDSAIAELRQLIKQTEKIDAENGVKTALVSKQTLLMNSIRSITTSLMPPDFNYISLTDALAHLCLDFENRSAIPCRITIQDDIPFSVSAEKQLQCYRLVQEALSNIEKHSKASTAFLVILIEDQGGGKKLCICVSDDGCGLTADGSPVELAGAAILSWVSAHNAFSALGIRTMYERALLMDGTMLLRSGSGSGTLIKVEIPYV